MPDPSRASEPTWTPAEFAAPTADGRLGCWLCPHLCTLRDGQLGRCKVRRRRGDELETATFATTTWHVTAIERKPLYHFLPGTQVLTLAAPGCTFACTYCQNFRLSQFGRDVEATWTAEPVDAGTIVERARALDVGAIGFSYAEPILSAELTLALAPLARAAGLAVVWKSNGFVTEPALARLAEAVDAVNIDLKTADDASHRALTGAAVGPVLAAIREFHARGIWVEVSTPIIPGLHTADMLARLAAHIAAVDPDIPWHLLRFHPDHRLIHPPPTSPTLLAAAVDQAHAAGLRYVYVERALGDAARTTRCPHCRAVAIEREPWLLRGVHLADGQCVACATSIAGVWTRRHALATLNDPRA